MFEQFQVLLTIIGVNIVLSGDNAIVIGMVAMGLPLHQRQRAIMWGIVLAALTRVVFSLVAFYLLQIPGLQLVGGLLLAWIAWGMWKDIWEKRVEAAAAEGSEGDKDDAKPQEGTRSFANALMAILVADVSMSLDNVLAIAGAARDHLALMVIGLIISVLLMGFAAALIAKLMERYHWITYIGAALVTYIAIDMTWEGGEVVYHLLTATGA